jgi:hypothetical protein
MSKATVVDIPADCMPMCKTCVFFVFEPQNDVGECRRYPPANIATENTLTYEFSITEPEFWCGEYKRLIN